MSSRGLSLEEIVDFLDLPGAEVEETIAQAAQDQN